MHLLVKKASRRWHRPLLGKLECVLQWQLLADQRLPKMARIDPLLSFVLRKSGHWGSQLCFTYKDRVRDEAEFYE